MTTNNAHDLLSYRKAKIIVKEVDDINVVLTDFYKKLSKYKKYTPIKLLLTDILQNKALLKMLHDKHINVLKTRGKMNEE